MRMPSEAATPVPTITAVGVAKPNAQGHAMTMTLMPNSSANRKGVWPGGSQEAGKAPEAPATYLGCGIHRGGNWMERYGVVVLNSSLVVVSISLSTMI